MLQILDRYLIKEVAFTLAAVMSVLSLIVTGNLFARLLGYVTEGELPADALMPLVGLGSARVIILLLPFSFFIGIMLTLGRLYRDNEMAALRACGVGYRQIYRPLLTLAVPLALLLGYAVLYLVPDIVERSETIKGQMKSRSEIVGVTPGRFIESAGGDRVIFVESLSDDSRTMQNIFVHAEDEAGNSIVVTAASAAQVVDPQTGNRYIEMKDGSRYSGAAGGAEYQIARFGVHGLLMPSDTQAAKVDNRDAIPTEALLASDNRVDRAELHWRISIPLSMLVLVLLAVPMSYTTPRQGRFGKVVIGILAYVIYVNALVAGKGALEKGELPIEVGLWWVHAAALLVVGGLIMRQYGWSWLSRKAGTA